MSRNVCVLSQIEAEGLTRGIAPDCNKHPHIRKSKAEAMTRSKMANGVPVVPTARWVGKDRILRVPGQRTWRVEKIEGGFQQMQFVP